MKISNNLPSNLGVYLLFLIVVLVWGLSWPIMKIGVAYIPPIWFGVGRLFIGAVCIFIYLIMTGQLRFPVKKDLPIIFTVGILQMALYLTFANLALVYAKAGRSALLSYITPIFVVPIAVIFFKEKLTKLKLIGLLISFVGVLVLFNPQTFNWHDKNILIANAFLILSALCWSLAILYARYGHWKNSLLALAAWELLLATVVCLILAIILEPNPTIRWSIVLAYTGIISSAFGFWGAVFVANRLSPLMSSVGFLGVPVCGLLLSTLILNEQLTLTDVVSMSLIIIGFLFIAIAGKKK